jgi:3-hydroxyisobutyrate dehydrogenase
LTDAAEQAFSGEEADLEQARPALGAMGENIFHVGPLGTGVAHKLLNNMLALPALFLTMEAMRIALKLGLDPRRAAAVIDASSGCNFLTRDWDRSRAVFDLFSRTEELAQLAMSLTQKDLDHACALAENSGVYPRVLQAARGAIRNCTGEEFRENLRSLI